MLEQFDIWRLLAGLGIFLFGMFLMEESVKNLAGRSFKRFIRLYTTGRIKSIFSGAFVTAILQSSSAVSLMVLAFVGAGIMAMDNAIGVIIGSNVGTTFTAWIVALFGFKLDIESFALPLIGIGGLGIIFLGKSPRYSNISKLMVGFGFLFMGLDYMKDSVSALTERFDVAQLPNYGLLFYLAISVLLTAIMQSSSAMIAIILTTLSIGLLDFKAACAMVIGANVGTTFTILLGAIGAAPVKKRVAFSHLFFNLVTAVIGFALLGALAWVVEKMAGVENEVVGVALFHTLFNVMGVLLFAPFIGLLAKLLVKIIPEKKTALTIYISNVTPEVSEAAVESIRNEVSHLIRAVLKYNLAVLNIDEKLVFAGTPYELEGSRSTKLRLEERYQNLKLLQADIFTFASKVQAGELEADDSKNLNNSLHAARIAIQEAKTLKDVKHNLDDFESADNDFLNRQYTAFRKRLIETYLSMVSVFQEEKHEEILSVLLKSLKKIEVEDKAFISLTQGAISKKIISDLEISTLLIVNRAIFHSSKHLIYALKELLLTTEEEKVFEKMTEIGEEEEESESE